MTDANSNVTVYGFADGPSYTNAVGDAYQGITYTNGGMLRQWIEPDGAITEYFRTYHFGVTTMRVHSVTGTNIWAYTDTTYPFYLASQTDPIGRTISYTRDDRNRMIRTELPRGAYETFAYNEYSQVLTNRFRDGAIWRYAYDEQGRRTRQIDPEGHTTHYQYDARDRLISESNALGYVTRYAYNWRGQLTNTLYAGWHGRNHPLQLVRASDLAY